MGSFLHLMACKLLRQAGSHNAVGILLHNERSSYPPEMKIRLHNTKGTRIICIQ